MSGEAGENPGLDPLVDRVPLVRPPMAGTWGRRSSGRPDAGFGNDRGGPTYAALDLGTNNCRLLVARPAGSGFRVVDAFSRIIRLGEGLAASGVLSEDAMARALDALKICADKIAGRRVAAGRYVATEACRQAANCEVFLARVREEIGIEIEIISSTEEARLDVASVWRGHPDRSVRRHRSFAGDLPRNGRRGGGGLGAVRARQRHPAPCQNRQGADARQLGDGNDARRHPSGIAALYPRSGRRERSDV